MSKGGWMIGRILSVFLTPSRDYLSLSLVLLYKHTTALVFEDVDTSYYIEYPLLVFAVSYVPGGSILRYV